jgi:short-subunit dehydrogenase
MKNCWIIGASSGIGYELAIKFYKNGFNVIASARTQKNLEDLKQLNENDRQNNQNNYGKLSIAVLDVEDEQSINNAFEKILNEYQKIDLVIFASALYERMLLENFDLKLAKKIMHVNFDGFLNVLNSVYPFFKKNRQGHIAVIASVAGYSGLPQSMSYGASKSALINLCEGIYPEMLSNNVHLTIINPGFVKTKLTAKNNFVMPFIIDANTASDIIYKGLIKKKFEIHFPSKFTIILKFLRIIPYKFYLPIINKIFMDIKNNDK